MQCLFSLNQPLPFSSFAERIDPNSSAPDTSCWHVPIFSFSKFRLMLSEFAVRVILVGQDNSPVPYDPPMT
ncbi:hypothetical protein BCON_0089g00200 [Botryotinia convoluta]|uniref:Uncharacterized protein n=1 Tax=Botryotinia convoluta TaxID=54673 RepID=A0A4Z1I4L1_9HELO|nr:hypothetical protein BCON_0089g00200 [Botryotinia convoluta]